MANVSVKELNYLKDFLSWELLMAKKCNEYANVEVDPKFKGIFNNAGQVHEQNYMNLVNYLGQLTNSQGGMMQ